MKLEIFKPQADALIGLDIGVSSVKMVELMGSEDAMRVGSYAVEPLAEGVIVDGNVLDAQALTKSLSACHKKLSSRSKNFAIALPSSMVSIKSLELPSGLSEYEYEDMILQQIGGYISIPIDDACVDFAMSENQKLSSDDGSNVTALVATTHRKNIDSRQAALTSSGFKLNVVESEIYSTLRVVHYFLRQKGIDPEGKNLLIVDLGSTQTQFHFTVNENVTYTREQPVGDQQLILELCSRLNVDDAQARLIASDPGTSQDESAARDLIDNFVQGLNHEIVRAIEVFSLASQVDGVEAVLLTGAATRMHGLSAVAEQAISCPVFDLNPFESMKMDSSIKELIEREPSSLVIAAGLAMRRFEK